MYQRPLVPRGMKNGRDLKPIMENKKGGLENPTKPADTSPLLSPPPPSLSVTTDHKPQQIVNWGSRICGAHSDFKD